MCAGQYSINIDLRLSVWVWFWGKGLLGTAKDWEGWPWKAKGWLEVYLTKGEFVE
jgi:hypothetical protein